MTSLQHAEQVSLSAKTSAVDVLTELRPVSSSVRPNSSLIDSTSKDKNFHTPNEKAVLDGRGTIMDSRLEELIGETDKYVAPLSNNGEAISRVSSRCSNLSTRSRELSRSGSISPRPISMRRPHTGRYLLSIIKGIKTKDISGSIHGSDGQSSIDHPKSHRKRPLTSNSFLTKKTSLSSNRRPVTMRSLLAKNKQYSTKEGHDVEGNSNIGSAISFGNSRSVSRRSERSAFSTNSESSVLQRPISSRDLTFMSSYVPIVRSNASSQRRKRPVTGHNIIGNISRPLTGRQRRYTLTRPVTGYSADTETIAEFEEGTGQNQSTRKSAEDIRRITKIQALQRARKVRLTKANIQPKLKRSSDKPLSESSSKDLSEVQKRGKYLDKKEFKLKQRRKLMKIAQNYANITRSMQHKSSKKIEKRRQCRKSANDKIKLVALANAEAAAIEAHNGKVDPEEVHLLKERARAIGIALTAPSIQYALRGELCASSKRGDLVQVLRLLSAKNKPNIDERNAHTKTPLLLAAKNGHTSVVQMLLENGADITLSDCQLNTVFHLVSSRGYFYTLKLLISYVLDIKPISKRIKATRLAVDARNNFGKTPVACAKTKEIKDALINFSLTCKDVEIEDTQLKNATVSNKNKIIEQNQSKIKSEYEDFDFQIDENGATTSVIIPYDESPSSTRKPQYRNAKLVTHNKVPLKKTKIRIGDIKQLTMLKAKQNLLQELISNARKSEKRRHKRMQHCKSEEERRRVASKFAMERGLATAEIARVAQTLKKLEQTLETPVSQDARKGMKHKYFKTFEDDSNTLQKQIQSKADKRKTKNTTMYDMYNKKLEKFAKLNNQNEETAMTIELEKQEIDIPNAKDIKNGTQHEEVAISIKKDQEKLKGSQTFEEWLRLQNNERSEFFKRYNTKKETLSKAQLKFQRSVKKAKALEAWRSNMEAAEAESSAFKIRELQRSQIRMTRITKAEKILEIAKKALIEAAEPLDILKEMESKALKRFERKKRVVEELSSTGRNALVIIKARKAQRDADIKWRKSKRSLSVYLKKHKACQAVFDAKSEALKVAKKELPRHLQRGRLFGPGAFSTPSDVLDTWNLRFTDIEENPQNVWVRGYYSNQQHDDVRGQDPRDYISNIAAILPIGHKNSIELQARKVQEKKWEAKLEVFQKKIAYTQAQMNQVKLNIKKLVREHQSIINPAGKKAIAVDIKKNEEELLKYKEKLHLEYQEKARQKELNATEKKTIEMENGGIYHVAKKYIPCDLDRFRSSKEVGCNTSNVFEALTTGDAQLAVNMSRLTYKAGPVISSMARKTRVLDRPGPHSFLELSLGLGDWHPHPIPPKKDFLNFFRWKPKGMSKDSIQKMLTLFSYTRQGLYNEVIELQSSPGWPLEIDAKDSSGNQLLHVAAQSENLKVLKLCLELGADMNAKGYNGNTAMHCAEGMQFKEIAIWLRANGAEKSMNMENRFGHTPEDVLIEELAPI